MKRSLIFAAACFLCAAGFAADQPKGPVNLDQIQTRIDKDLTAGKLTQNDANLLKEKMKQIQRVQEQADRGGGMTHRTRRDVRTDAQQLQKEIERMEKQAADAKAAASATP